MKIIISPHKKIILMVGLVIVFSTIIHFFIIPNIFHILNYFSNKITITLGVIAGIFIFAMITYTRMFRPWAPGPPSWQEKEYLTPLSIEKSFKGVVEVTVLVIKVLIFSISLYTVTYYSIHLYVKNIPLIINGTYVYNKLEASFMFALFFFIFTLILYGIVQIYVYLRKK